MENKGKLARSFFEQGYNCCQSVVLAFAEEAGLSQELAARLSSGFGGGLGRLREVCGALSGITLLLGLLEGYSAPEDTGGKQALYETVQRLAGRFRDENGSLLCRELLEASENPADTSPTPSKRTVHYYSRRPCAGLVECAAGVLEEYLGEH